MFGADLPPYSVALWHGFTPPLLLSIAAFAGGGILYWALQRRYNLHLHVPLAWTARRLAYGLVGGLAYLAGRVTVGLDNGSLQRSLAVLFVVAFVLGAAPLVGSGVTIGDRAFLPVTPLGAMAGLVLAAAALGCVLWHRERLVAILLTSVVGLVVSLAFLGFSAPDLALTQLAVEVVTTVLMLMALARLPQTSPRESSPRRRARDVTLAGLAGVGVAGIALMAMTRRLETISWYFIEHSVPLGGGANVVNVILVDFRGYDTFGEITVLTIAALGVAAMLDGVAIRRLHAAAGSLSSPLLFVVAARWLLPVALVVSVYILLRGHNAPGGGFVAGLITSVALVLQYMAHGSRWAALAVALGLRTACRDRPARRGRDWSRRVVVRQALPHERPRRTGGTGARSATARVGGALRHRRIPGSRRHHDAGARFPGDHVGQRRRRRLSVEPLVAAAIGLLTACGMYLMLRGRTFPLVLGLTLLSYAANLFVLAMGRLAVGVPPLVADGVSGHADPLPQALVLTAIVIGLATTAFTISLALVLFATSGTDHVDGRLGLPARDDVSQR